MSDVPERGKPETMTISESMKTRPHDEGDQMLTLKTPRKQRAETMDTMNQ